MLLATADKTLQQSSNMLKQIANTVFGDSSFFILVLSLVASVMLGNVSSLILRRLSCGLGCQADAATDLGTVNRYRRLEI
jgi:hypothetical protein